MKPYWPITTAGRVIAFLAQQNGLWSTYGSTFIIPTVQAVLPIGTTEKAQQRYMKLLQKRGLVGGCDCGCRGDYAPKELGLIFLANECKFGEQELKRWKKEGYTYGY